MFKSRKRHNPRGSSHGHHHHLQLPFIAAAQAQKHVTHNEALRGLDAVVQLMVLDKDLAAPPGSPAEGARYIVAGSATGAWAGQEGKIAAWQDGAWAFYAPREGWLAWAADEDALYIYSGSAWTGFAVGLGDVVEDTTPQLGGHLDANAFNIGFDDATGITDDAGNEQLVFRKTASAVNQVGLTNAATGNAPRIAAEGNDTNINLQLRGKGTGCIDVDKVGINASADATNRLSMNSPASLFNHAGNGHQVKVQECCGRHGQLPVPNQLLRPSGNRHDRRRPFPLQSQPQWLCLDRGAGHQHSRQRIAGRHR